MDEAADGHDEARPPTDLAARRDGDPGTVGGLIRRVRRRLDVSQRRLADLLGVEASRVARWETGRTSPQVVELEAVLALADLRLVVVDCHDEIVDPMSEGAVRDRAGRRYPAHVRPPGGRVVDTARQLAHVKGDRRGASVAEARRPAHQLRPGLAARPGAPLLRRAAGPSHARRGGGRAPGPGPGGVVPPETPPDPATAPD